MTKRTLPHLDLLIDNIADSLTQPRIFSAAFAFAAFRARFALFVDGLPEHVGERVVAHVVHVVALVLRVPVLGRGATHPRDPIVGHQRKVTDVDAAEEKKKWHS